MFHYGLSMLFMSALITYACATTCYLPDGSAIGGLRTCNPSAPASACCAGTDECTSAGLCKAGNDGDNNWMWRGPCTDKTWQSEDCPRYCYNSTTSDNAASVNFKVMACSENTYCCSYPDSYYPLTGNTFDCCDDPARAFTAGPAIHIAGFTVTTQQFVGFTTVSGYAKVPGTVESASSSSVSSAQKQSASSSPSSSTTPSTDSSVPSSTTSSKSQTTDSAVSLSVTTVTPTQAIDASLASDSSLPASSRSSGDSGLSTGASAGIGVGATVGALALIAIGVFAGLRIRKRGVAGRSSETEAQALDRSHEQWGLQPAYSQVSSREDKDAVVGINEGGWQLPSEADSMPRGELEGHPVDKSR